MKRVGIVAEYNPFHAGHRLHIAETRRRLGTCAVIAVMSGNFVQRGECAITDKWTRTCAALQGGVDLVLDLPTVWAASSAQHFAQGAVSLLRQAGVQALSFGSESGDAQALTRLAECLEGEPFRAGLRHYLDKGMPFAACRQAVTAALAGDELAGLLSNPNDNLAVEYILAARRLGWEPELVAVPRVGAGHDGGDHPEFPSASCLRECVWAGEMPMENPACLRCAQRAVLSRLRAMAPEDFAALPDCGEGLDRRLYQAARKGVTLEEVYSLAKTKRYAHARIRRAVLWAALGLKEADRPAVPPYLRVLGADGRGRAVLRALDTTLPVITRPARGKGLPLLELEAKCTDFYALCREKTLPCGAEWTHSPVIVD